MAEAPVAVAVAAPVEGAAPVDRSKPPGRVRHMYKQLDANSDGSLTKAELEASYLWIEITRPL